MNFGSQFVYSFLTPIFLVCFLILFTITPRAWSEAQNNLQSDKLEKLEELKEKEDKYRKLIDVKTREKDSLAGQVQSLEKQSKTLEQDIGTKAIKIDTLSQDISTTQKKVQTKKSLINSQKTLLASMIRNNYESFRSRDQMAQIANTSGANFSHSASEILITQKLAQLTNIIVQERKELEKEEESLLKQKQEIAILRKELEQKNQAIEKAKQVKEIDAIETTQEQRKYEERLEDVLAQQLEIQSEIDSLATSYIGTFSLKDLPKASDVDFVRPVTSPYKVTQGYGKTSFSHHYKGGNHNGVDYSGRFKHDIRSAGDGKVLQTGNMGRYGYGKWIAIDHGNNLVSLYGHLSRINVNSGDKVDKGERIATMGNTGFSTATHLHFSIFVKSTFRTVNSSSVSGIKIPSGATVNPALYY